MKPKEWLLANGHIKEITRGRMSRENIALIEQAVRDGVQIEGYAVSTVKPKTEAEKASPKVEKVAAPSERILDVPDESRSEELWEAYTFVDGKRVEIGMRTVDNNCGNSLTYCRCRTATVFLDHETTAMVNFTPRTKPLSNKRW